MANFSAFENYGKRLPQDHNEEPIIQREEAVFNLEKVGKAIQKSEPNNFVEVVVEEVVPTTKEKHVVREPLRKMSSKRGRPIVNISLPTISRTYKLPEIVIRELEDVFYENRGEWAPTFNFSQYISNLIWKETHGGELLYDPETGKPFGE